VEEASKKYVSVLRPMRSVSRRYRLEGLASREK